MGQWGGGAPVGICILMRKHPAKVSLSKGQEAPSSLEQQKEQAKNPSASIAVLKEAPTLTVIMYRHYRLHPLLGCN